MSKFDGTDEPLTLGQLFVYMAELTPWGHDDMTQEAIRTLHTAFPDDVTPYTRAPNTGVTDPMIAELNNQAIKLAQQQQELAELRASLAEAQLAEARAQLAAINAGAKPSDVGVTEDIHPTPDPVAVSGASLAEASARTRGETTAAHGPDVPLGDGAVVTGQN